jgi:hypothetical protein
MKEVMFKAIVTPGASLIDVIILGNALSFKEVTELVQKRRVASAKYPQEDVDLRFPMLDLRHTALERTANGNRNILRLFNNLQHLWDTKVVSTEHFIGRQYNYIMILRDDSLWLDDFDLNKLLAVNPAADAYVLSCDAREPAMLSPEMNDHAIVIKREKAAVVGRYFSSSLLSADIEAC